MGRSNPDRGDSLKPQFPEDPVQVEVPLLPAVTSEKMENEALVRAGAGFALCELPDSVIRNLQNIGISVEGQGGLRVAGGSTMVSIGHMLNAIEKVSDFLVANKTNAEQIHLAAGSLSKLVSTLNKGNRVLIDMSRMPAGAGGPGGRGYQMPIGQPVPVPSTPVQVNVTVQQSQGQPQQQPAEQQQQTEPKGE